MSDEGPTLLVVDDNEDNRFTLTERLKRQGYTNLSVAENGRVALDVLATEKIDLVLLDIMMPEMNGYEVLERMKADTMMRQIPVIMISAVDEMDSVIRCIELGAEDYLPKPFNRSLLKARVDASLEKKRLRDQQAAYLAEIDSARKRADDLLYAMLPRDIVRELKAADTVQPRRHQNVAVLFCDVVDFTRYCDEHAPEDVVVHLQQLIDMLEETAERHGLEKIKTIGDAFMATAGLIGHHDDPVLASVQCGLDMAQAVGELDSNWQVRVGIHAGPVVAGVIGRKHYMYDLWGDTVNIAARVVAEADPGRVVVTGSAWVQLRDRCRGRSLGEIEIKGKGALELIECQPMS